jgi:hypothetical protein
VKTLPLVPDLHEGEHVAARFCMGGVLGIVDEFGFEYFEEARYWRVVERIALAAHGCASTDAGKRHPVVGYGILRSAVRMRDQAWGRSLARNGHVERSVNSPRMWLAIAQPTILQLKRSSTMAR